MDDFTIAVIILIIVIVYSYFSKSSISQPKSTFSIPTNLMGQAGLDYVRQNYASELSQARSLCESQFKGSWIDSSNSIGCYNIQGFSDLYCGTDVISQFYKACSSIGGSPVCTSSQLSCTV